MLLAALRDLQWRRKRFAITIVGTALVFALSLLMSGLSHAFVVEIDRTLDDQGAEWWITRAEVPGAFSPGSFLTTVDVAAITAPTSGLDEAAGVLYGPATVDADPASDDPDDVVNVTVFGVTDGALGAPTAVVDGSAQVVPGSVIVPRSLGMSVGDTVRLASTDFVVGGIVDKASLIAGTPTLTLELGDAQRLMLGGQPLVSMVVATGDPTLPDGYRADAEDRTRDDLLRPLENPVRSIDFVKVLLWTVAGLIVASVVYLTVLERSRDLAVFKATGVRSVAIGAGICLQAVIMAVLASLLGILLAVLLAPAFPMDVAIAGRSMVTLPLLAVAVGVLAGLTGVWRSMKVSPATAFGGP